MPQVYEKIRDEYVKKGVPYDQAQSYAAATYNKIRKSHPGMEKLSNKPDKKSKTGMSKGIGASSKDKY